MHKRYAKGRTVCKPTSRAVLTKSNSYPLVKVIVIVIMDKHERKSQSEKVLGIRLLSCEVVISRKKFISYLWAGEEWTTDGGLGTRLDSDTI